jgi:amino acid adenylation domain-containing protein
LPAEVREGLVPGTAEAERHRALREWNDTGRPFRADACVHELFAEQAARTPSAVAVVDGRRTLTYAELDRSADRLALRLRGLGVGPEVRAAVAAERSAEMVVALLAVLKAGGAYVPLDPAYPAERLASMLHDSGAAVLLAQRGVLPSLPPFTGPVVVLGEEEGAAGSHPEGESRAGRIWAGERSALPDPSARSSLQDDGERAVLPENLAYVIYTSGSTGRPKGVLLTHRGLVNLVAAQVRLFAIGPDSAVLQFASFSFDASVSEIFTALLSGAQLHLAERADLIPGPDLERTVRERGITVATLAPTALAALDDPGRLPSLRTVVSAGEACPAPLAARWSRGRRFLNAYGPTEVTVCATAEVVAERVAGDPSPGGVPIGRPIDNIRVAVLAPDGGAAADGVAGEIALSGIGLARGYLGRPDLTAERFIPALAGEPGERAYRTGDLGRWLPDGRLELLGRIDQQIKVRGYRIEPGEIEAAMASLPGIAEAAVVARDEPGGDRRLAAFFVPAGRETQPAELRRQLARQLPEHMVPAVFIPLSSFPLTPNGKVDRAALARRPLPQEEAVGGGAALRGPVEELIAAVWADVLGLSGSQGIGAHDRFFDLGGHSLLATQVLSRLRQAFGVELTMRDFFAAPTVAGLAERIARSGVEAQIELPPVEPVPHDRPLPLSFAQRRLWLLENLEPGSPLYNLPQALALRGPLQTGALAAALREIVRGHEVLRTRFDEVESLPVQVVLPPPAAALPLADLSALPLARRLLEADRLTLEEARRPFDLAAPPMLRMLLLHLGGGEHRLLLTVHHIASDGWSQGILTAELSALYGAFAAGRPSPLPELPVQYGDFAVWQQRWLTESALAPHLAYWRRHLEGAPTLLELPADRPRPAVRSAQGALLRGGADGVLARGVRELARRQGATPFMILLAAFQALLHRVSGAEQLLVGTPIANRNRAETEGLIGFFVNTLVMRADLEDLEGTPTFLDLLARTREATLEAHAHQDLPFEKLVEELRPERDLSHTPLFQVMLVLESLPAPPDLAGLEVAALPVDNRTAKFDLTLIAADRPEAGLELDLEYSTDLFDAPTMGRLLTWLRTLLAGAVADPAARLSALPLLGEVERFQVLTEWNDTADLPEPLASLGELFAAQAARTPEAEALVAPGERLTYRELDRRAARLAGHLRTLGVGPEALCGVLLDRSPDLVVALLAVHKAGGAYVPLDPAYPASRVALMLETSRAAVVITRRERLAGLDLPAGTRPVLLEAGWEEAKEGGGGPIGPIGRIGRIDPANLAYLIFTSGSTGVPKGVALTHGNAAAFLAWAWGVFPPEDLAGVLASTSVCFDLSVFELFATLCRGGKVILAENALALAQHPAAGEVTLINTVPSAMAELLKSGAVPPSVRTVNLAGEPLKNALAQEIYERTSVRRVLDLYGPSEDTTYSTFAPVERGSGRAPAIGRPIAGTRAYLLDAALHAVPLGIPGALYLAGAGLARGYLGRPDLTAERFVPDPFAVRPGERLYQTGDLARFRPDGQLDFLGRIDQQVKVRGFRIEPGEIEAALVRHPEVREAAVLALADVGGEGKRLVAFVALWLGLPGEATGCSQSPKERDGQSEPGRLRASLRAFLQERLPHYMVPSLFLSLPALPLTPNGKIDRKALARLGEGSRRAASEEGFVAPRTPLEETLAAVWAGVFKRPRIGVHDNFFDLGGHSLLAAQVVSRLRAALGIDIPLRRLFEAPTIERLARSLEPALAAQGTEPGGTAALLLQPVEPGGAGTPLSFAQRRLWFFERMTPGSAAYNLPYPLLLEGSLNAPALERALSEIVRRHEALRTTFREGPDGPIQGIAAPAPNPLPRIDLTALAEERRGAVLAELVREESSRPFDLAAGPLLRTVLVRKAPREHALLLTVHHIVADGWSLGVWVDELTALYAAFRAGEPSPLPELPAQYSDFARWQRQRLRGEERTRLLEYWRHELAGAPAVLELPADHPRPAVPTFRGCRRGRALPPGLAAAVRDLGRREGATLFMIALAAFEALLFRLTRREDLLVGAPVANRGRADFEGLIGFFVNTLVLRADLAGDPSFRELLGRVRETALAAYAHEDLPFDTLVEELRPERDRSHQPLCQVALVVENGRPEPAVDGLRLAPLPVDTGTAKFDLTLTVSESGAGLTAGIELASDLFTPVTAERILDQFSRLLAAAVENPGQRLLDLPLLSAAERHQSMIEWNDARSAYPREALVHDLVAEQAARTPEAVAVEQGEARMTYRELDERAEGLAAHLRELGVGPDVPVALLMERAPETIAALLAVLKAGGAYAPLDPGHPRERLALVLADTGAPVVLVHGHLVDRLPEGTAARVIRIERGSQPRALPWAKELRPVGSEKAPENAEGVARVGVGPKARASLAQGNALGRGGGSAAAAAATADHLAYVLYTSGTTGRPKGVAVPHRAVVRLVRGINYAGLGPGEVLLQAGPIAFDASTFEIWGALANGGRLVLYPGERPSPDELGAVIARHGVTTLWLTAGLFQQVVDAHPGGFGTVRQLLSGGDVLSPRHVRAALTALPGCTVINGYGPTEGTTFTCFHPMTDAAEVREPVPLGRPVANSAVYLLDAALRPVPIGVPGELYAGGDGLARGYFGRPELTAERFVPDPLGDEPGGRLYATGDLARWLPGGQIEFLGRIDQQVKIRGFRIEPAEIEAVLGKHPEVAAAAVLVRRETDGEKRLVACVVPRSAPPPSPGELRAFLKERLPEAMIPAAFVTVGALPLNANGKVDRRALDALAAASLEGGEGRAASSYMAPRTPVESAIAQIWQEVLGVDRVGVTDNFFDLGGHSLLVMRVLSRIRCALHVDLPAQTLFEAPTVAALAELVERAGVTQGRGGGTPQIEPAAREVWEGRLPLSSGQRRLWFFEALDPGSSVLNVPAPLRLTGRLSPAALTAALTEMVRRHEALRTVFPTWEGEPYQEVRPAGPAALPLVDLAGLPASARESEAARLAADDARRPFDLAHGPLLRTALVRLAAAEHLLLATFHHIVTDGWSNEVFTRELLALHEAFAAGRPSPLPPLPAQYPDFAVWQQRWLTGDTVENLVATWKRHFGDSLPVLRLPTDRPRPAELTFAGDYRSRRLPALLAERVRALGPGHGATLFMTLLAAFQALLRAYAGQDTVVVGTPVAGRGRTELEGMIGFFVNTLVLRGDLDGDPTFQELLERTRDRALGAFACQDLPFEKLVDALQPERDRSRSPLFQVMFALQSAQPAPPPRPLAASPYGGGTGTAQFDLTLYMADLPEGLTAGVEFNTDLFDAMTVERLLGHYQDLLERVTENPRIRLSELSVPPLVERAAAPPVPEATQPAAESIDSRRARMAARLAHLPAAQREAMERRLRGGGEDS